MDAALPIITVNEAGDHFELNESNLQTVLDAVEKINANKVVILSVVGAFRTGKSLLLDFFLRYLRHSAEEEAEGVIVDADTIENSQTLPVWMTTGSSNFLKTSRGDVDGKASMGEQAAAAATDATVESKAADLQTPRGGSGFIWRPGKDRTTTGIWMYGKPFIRELPGSHEKVAVVLMDTQGMFDFNTTKELTAAIFGLSTLISSFEIYNVTKQIQEDYLQQLHYFTEFSRVALKEFDQAQKRAEKQLQKSGSASSLNSGDAESKSDGGAGLRRRKQGGGEEESAPVKEPFSPSEAASGSSIALNKKKKKGKKASNADESSSSTTPASSSAADSSIAEEDSKESNKMCPFQTLQFLVRDWANFSDDENIEKCLEEMPKVLETAMNATVEDGGTRAQLRAAFDKISCFLLPHPGIPMTKPKYDGDVSAIERNFLRLLDIFTHQVFEKGLVTKKIQGREVSPKSLFRYIKAYAEIFKEGRLPQTMTLVQAISVTTNLCAKDDALKVYKTEMDRVLGGDKSVNKEVFASVHTASSEFALEKFDSLATFGEEQQISETRSKLLDLIEEERVNYSKTNDLKMQSGLQRFVVPLIIAVGAFTLDRITDYTCDAWSESCRSLSLLFLYAYLSVFAALSYQLYNIYKDQGSAAVGMSFMALGHATFQRVKSMQDMVTERVTGATPGRTPGESIELSSIPTRTESKKRK